MNITKKGLNVNEHAGLCRSRRIYIKGGLRNPTRLRLMRVGSKPSGFTVVVGFINSNKNSTKRLVVRTAFAPHRARFCAVKYVLISIPGYYFKRESVNEQIGF